MVIIYHFYIICQNFDKLPEKYRKFENLPDKYRNLFFVLAKDENADVRKSVIHALGRNFEGLPEEYKKILLYLSEDESPHVRARVALFVGHNYEKLPQAYQKILLKLKSDSLVLDLLRKWIDRNEPDERQKKIIRILKSEIDL
ncbi:MAG: HEAT repeat domain-containing protein [Theionarchaea archaeon]|nr:HEAT repeat domain-containing protein [Theionarchaea archaeon]